MALELKKQDPVPEGVRRIVRERIDRALKTMQSARRGLSDHAVHEARKRFREIRGILRLVREELGDDSFRRENSVFRDAGRPLSVLRDAKVLVDTLDRLIAHFDGRVKPDSLLGLRRSLLGRRRLARKQVLEQNHAVPEIIQSIQAARQRVDEWPLERDGWEAIEGGLGKVYTKGRRAMKEGLADGSDEALHEWRKRTKDLRYNLELLQPVWPETIKPLAEQAHRLSDLLGDDHDLSVLRTVAQEAKGHQSSEENELLFALIDERRIVLKREAEELGEKLYEESGKEFIKRLKGYWKASHEHVTAVHS